VCFKVVFMYFEGFLTFQVLKPTRWARNDKNFLSFFCICKILLNPEIQLYRG
jgi:hypothetical protein